MFPFVKISVIAGLALVATACEKQSSSTGVRMGEFKKVDDFTFTTQNAGELSLGDLKGKVWIANFIFTSCAAECLVLSARIAELQRQFHSYEEVAFVSFSVDPQTDTPERLGAFSERWHADPGKWHFLTGEPAELDGIVRNSFLLPVTRDPVELGTSPSSNLVHSSKIAVVDKSGVVRAYVDGLPEESVASISRIVAQLLQELSSETTLSETYNNTSLE